MLQSVQAIDREHHAKRDASVAHGTPFDLLMRFSLFNTKHSDCAVSTLNPTHGLGTMIALTASAARRRLSRASANSATAARCEQPRYMHAA